MSIVAGLLGMALGTAQEIVPEDKAALKDSRQLTWEANREVEEDQYVSAEAKYRRAISKSEANVAAPYNLGNTLYQQENYSEAFGSFKAAGEKAMEKPEKHKAYHNMGNVFMKHKEYEKAVEAYKEALRNNPTDEETRYNLALAKEMLKKQQSEQQDQQNEDNQDNQDQQEQNQDQQQDQGDQENEDQQQNQDQQQDQGDQGEQQQEENKEGEGNEKEEQQKQPQSEEEGENQQAPRPNQLSPLQIQNLLEAMQNEERKVQEKLDAQKVKGIPTKSKKDW